MNRDRFTPRKDVGKTWPCANACGNEVARKDTVCDACWAFLYGYGSDL